VAFPAEAKVTVVVADGNVALEAGTLTSGGLLLEGLRDMTSSLSELPRKMSMI